MDNKEVSFDIQVLHKILKITIKGDYEEYDTMKNINGIRVKLTNPTLTLEKEKEIKISNDTLALIAVLGFFPVIPCKCTLSFPFPVSYNFTRSLSLSYILPKVHVAYKEDYVDDKMFVNEDTPVICYGGGIDSTAAKNLFNESIVVHEKPMLDGDYSLPFEGVAYVTTNIRQLFSVYGLPIWMSIFIVCLLYNTKYIVSGSQFSSSHLFDGLRYFPRINNQFYKVFERNGYKILPMDFLTEIINMRIVHAVGDFDKTAFCSAIRRKKCTRCTKCLRKYLEISSIDESYMDQLKRFDLGNKDLTDLFYKEKLYFGCHYTYCINKILEKNKNKNLHKNLYTLKTLIDPHKINVDLDFLERYYYPSLDTYPEPIRSILQKKLKEFDIEPMTNLDIKNVHAFKQV